MELGEEPRNGECSFKMAKDKLCPRVERRKGRWAYVMSLFVILSTPFVLSVLCILFIVHLCIILLWA